MNTSTILTKFSNLCKTTAVSLLRDSDEFVHSVVGVHRYITLEEAVTTILGGTSFTGSAIEDLKAIGYTVVQVHEVKRLCFETYVVRTDKAEKLGSKLEADIKDHHRVMVGYTGRLMIMVK